MHAVEYAADKRTRDSPNFDLQIVESPNGNKG